MIYQKSNTSKYVEKEKVKLSNRFSQSLESDFYKVTDHSTASTKHNGQFLQNIYEADMYGICTRCPKKFVTRLCGYFGGAVDSNYLGFYTVASVKLELRV